MPWPSLASKKILGVDVGSSIIKIVELGKAGEKIKLENYGFLQSKFLYGKPFRSFEKGTLSLASQDVAGAIASIVKTAKIRTRSANFSLPDFSSFVTSFQLPPMTRDELAEAVRFEARQHIPLPISEMALDWVLVEGKPSEKRQENLKVLLVAVPQRIIGEYQEIARLAKLRLQNLEAEVFALKRALLPEQEKKVVALVDIGTQSTTCSIVEGGTLKLSHSFDVSGDDLTKGLTDALELDPGVAERLKLKYGLSPESQVIHKVLQPLLNSVIMEIEKIARHFFQIEGKQIEEVILAGGAANLKGIKEYFAQRLKKEIRIGNPFLNVAYPPILQRTLKESGPFLAIATGVARGSLR